MADVAAEFRAAEAQERRHLLDIRGLVSEAVLGKRGTVH